MTKTNLQRTIPRFISLKILEIGGLIFLVFLVWNIGKFATGEYTPCGVNYYQEGCFHSEMEYQAITILVGISGTAFLGFLCVLIGIWIKWNWEIAKR